MSQAIKMVGTTEAYDVALSMADKMFKYMEKEGKGSRDASTLSAAEFKTFKSGLKQHIDRELAQAIWDRIEAFAPKGNQMSMDDLNKKVKASIKQSITRAANNDGFISAAERIATGSHLAEVAYLAAKVADARSEAAKKGWETRNATKAVAPAIVSVPAASTAVSNQSAPVSSQQAVTFSAQQAQQVTAKPFSAQQAQISAKQS